MHAACKRITPALAHVWAGAAGSSQQRGVGRVARAAADRESAPASRAALARADIFELPNRYSCRICGGCVLARARNPGRKPAPNHTQRLPAKLAWPDYRAAAL